MSDSSPSKAQLRRRIERQVRDFLRDGGEVAHVPHGVSGTDPAIGAWQRPGVREKRPERTSVASVIATIEARRRAAAPPRRHRPPRPKPRRKAIYDEFGEPVRWVWVDG